MTSVVFDFGGVMSAHVMPDNVRPILARLNIPWEIAVRGYEKFRRQMDGDQISLAEMYRLIWEDARIDLAPADAAEIVAADLGSFLVRNERTMSFIKSVKARGFRLGILTNMPSTFAPYFRETYGDVVSLADAVVISGEEHLYKPMPEIYALLQARLGVSPAEICFFDDAPANCEGARQAGWHVIRWLSNDQAEDEFNQLLTR